MFCQDSTAPVDDESTEHDGQDLVSIKTSDCITQ